MLERIGDIVRTARARQGRSVEELAAQSGIEPAVLAALEQGRQGITTTQLDEVARALLLDFPALLNGREVTKPTPSVFLRHAAMQDFDDRDTPALDEALEQGRNLAGLRALLGEPALALQAGVFAPHEAAADRRDAPAQDGYRRARDVRRWLGNPAEPLGDMVTLLEERFGVAVIVRALEATRVTAVGVRAEACAAVVLNARDLQRAKNPLLTRVYLAHELGHILFDPSGGGLHIVLDRADERKGQKVEAAEQRARAFAAELLLPLAGLTRTLGAGHVSVEMGAALALVARARSHFGTPHEIAVNHLCNLGFVALPLRGGLEADRTTFVGAPPAARLPERDAPSPAVAALAERAHREGLITDGEARSALGLDRLALLPWEAVEL